MLSRLRLTWLFLMLGGYVCIPAAGLFAQTDWTVPRAQPFVDVPWQSRYEPCLDPGPLWSCDPTAEMVGPNGEVCQSCQNGQLQNGMGPACGAYAHRKCGWYASADFIPLFYDSDVDVHFAQLGTDVVLNDADLATDFNAGGRFVIGTAITNCMSIEGGYQGFYNYADSAAVRDQTANALGGTGTLSTPFSNFGNPLTTGVDYNNLVEIGLRNNYNTAELNLRYRLDMPPGAYDISFLVGARFAELDEQFGFRSRSNVPAPSGAVNKVLVDTTNEMWGAQLGFNISALITRKGWVSFDAKGALLNNDASQSTLYTNIDENGVVSNFPGQAQRTRTAFLGELLLVGNYQLTPHMTFRAGYQATWISGVALGMDNFQTNLTTLRVGPTSIDHSGTAIYHGPVIGFEFAR